METAMAMEVHMMEADLVDFSGYNSTASTATTEPDDHGCSWNSWSPVVDWTALAGDHDDFHGLVESIMIDGDKNEAAEDNHAAASPEEEAASSSWDGGASKGVRLVHLLMAAAEAIGGGESCRSRDLARVILVRLKEMLVVDASSSSSSSSTNIERLAAHFSDALHSLLECAGGGGGGPHGGDHHHENDVVAAFQLLQEMSPYVKFGHFTANQAILEATSHDRRIHVIDYDIMEGIQWASLIHALASSRKDSHLRITAVTRGGSAAAASRRSIGTVQDTGRRLSAFAASVGLQGFSFHQCRLDSDESFRPSAVKVVRGEAVIVNCVLSLPHYCGTARSPASFLSAARTLNPKLVTVVEEEAPAAAAAGGDQFVGRFMELLHHYSAVYDSLEAGFPMQTRARALVERVFLGPRIVGSLGRIYREWEMGGGGGVWQSWGEWLSTAGFRGIAMSSANVCQAKLLLGLFDDGYRVEEMATNKIVLGWKSRRLLAASLWAPPPPSPSSSDSTL